MPNSLTTHTTDYITLNPRFKIFAGGLSKMSNFLLLARPSASLAPARRPHPPRLRSFLRAKFICPCPTPPVRGQLLYFNCTPCNLRIKGDLAVCIINPPNPEKGSGGPFRPGARTSLGKSFQSQGILLSRTVSSSPRVLVSPFFPSNTAAPSEGQFRSSPPRFYLYPFCS